MKAKQWLSFWHDPNYRTRLVFFLVLGVLLILAAVLVPTGFWRDVIIQIAVVFVTVALVQFLWDFLGGQPSEVRLSELLRGASSLNDIVGTHLGIERIWGSRREWEADTSDGLKVWKQTVCSAQEVSIVSNTFWALWLQDDIFAKELLEATKKGTQVKLIVYDPDGIILGLRAEHEKEAKIKAGLFQMQVEIISTLKRIAQIHKDLPDHCKGNLKVGLTRDFYHLAQIICADNRMVIANYLVGKGGSPTPTMQIHGTDTRYYKTYREQFNILWDGSTQLTSEELKRYDDFEPSTIGTLQ